MQYSYRNRISGPVFFPAGLFRSVICPEQDGKPSSANCKLSGRRTNPLLSAWIRQHFSAGLHAHDTSGGQAVERTLLLFSASVEKAWVRDARSTIKECRYDRLAINA
jgi:hypothetical protein